MKLKLGTCLLAGLFSATPAVANDWTGWRGPEQDGVSREKNLPDRWSPDGENLAWTSSVGGMSCPIVMNGHVYVLSRVGEVPAGNGITATVDPGPKTQEALTCLDEKTGKIVWQHLQNMFQTDAPFHRLGWSSPAGDPETGNVYALGTQCNLVACDGNTGKVVWHHQMTEEYGMISTFGGRTSSPKIDEDQMFLAGVSFGWGEEAGSAHRLFAFDKKTGALNWSAATGGIPVDAPYCTPVVTVINGQRLVIMQAGDGSIDAFQAHTGKRVWRYQASKHGFNSSVIAQGKYIYAAWDLDNFDSNRLGAVVCLDGSKISADGEPEVVWKQEGIEDGFPSPTIADGTLFCLTDNGQLYAIDAKTGQIKYHKGMGTQGKASLVWGDGKLYVAEAYGRVTVVKPERTKFQIVSRAEVSGNPGREYVIFGSPAISDGHLFVETATAMYCVGPKEFTKQEVKIPELPKDQPAEPNAAPAKVLVSPTDIVLRPGQKVTFKARAYDKLGRLIGDVKPEKWAVGQLKLPPPPIRPKELMRTNSAAAAEGKTAETKPATPAAPSPAPMAGKTPPRAIGNLKGEVDNDGNYVAAGNNGIFEGGGVIATVGNLSGVARVRVLPPLPWHIDFEHAPADLQPLTWIGVGMKPALKFVVRQDPDDAKNKLLIKVTDIPLFARARTYFGTPDQSNYTMQADVKVDEKVFNDNGVEVHKMPDAGIIDSRYVMELKGSDQTLNLYGWGAAIPRNELVPGLATHKAIVYPWKAHAWYTLKLVVRQEPDKAVLQGKVWERGKPEPKDWTIELDDPMPNTHGPAGLWGFSNDLEIYYDNIRVTPNNPQAVTENIHANR